MLHCGQPASPASLLISVVPLRRRQTDAAADERLEHFVTLKPGSATKGSTRTLKYGPVCRAGAHIVCVTLNGAHVVGSPLNVLVAPSVPDASQCELRPQIRGGGGRAPAGGMHTSEAVATNEVVVGLQLRDR